MNDFEIEKISIAIDVLQLLRDKIQNGDFEDWGLDDFPVCVTKTFLENIVNGYYS